MSKLLALACGLAICSCLVAPSFAADSVSDSATLTIFLSNVSDPAPIAFMQTEVARLLEPSGFKVAWKDWQDRQLGVDFARLVSVQLRGDCIATPLRPTLVSSEPRSLASTAIADGKILPFAFVECETLRSFMASTLHSSPKSRRTELFGRAMGRLLAHEVYHMLVQTRSHQTSGVSKPCFSIADLVAERFHFDESTIEQLRPESPDPSLAHVSFPETEISGR